MFNNYNLKSNYYNLKSKINNIKLKINNHIIKKLPSKIFKNKQNYSNLINNYLFSYNHSNKPLNNIKNIFKIKISSSKNYKKISNNTNNNPSDSVTKIKLLPNNSPNYLNLIKIIKRYQKNILIFKLLINHYNKLSIN